ncbi:hypothetical protein OG689_13275 [Kitasatospora sp. NBC_00240]|uniref:hypothetical protein n=1 Tax=Kitasatospora sp. NBC_00240 TaxID=2903567 RepID=UPI0022532E27|nr:hypothetical protein [Kitasatospora sp. NBC_00240]MCX5210249.1 hypothetical protein [Kitasatospora sp. NBC_00240]
MEQPDQEPAEAAEPAVADTPDTPDGTAPDDHGVPAGPRRRRWMAVLTVVALALGGAGYAFADNFAALGAYRFQAPAQFRGMALEPDSPLTLAVRRRAREGAADPSAFGTVHSSEGEHRMVIVQGYERHAFVPSLDESTRAAGDDAEFATAFTERRTVDPGARGGVMECGRLAMDEGLVAGVCFWADGSMTAMYSEVDEFGGPPEVEEVAAHAREMRLLAEVPA